MAEQETDRLLTVQEVADVLRVSRWSVGRYVDAGVLQAVRLPAGIRIPLSSLTAYIEANTVTAKETR